MDLPQLRPAPPAAVRRAPPRPRPRTPEPGFKHYFFAAAFSVIVGVTLPSLLTALHLCLLDKYANERLLNFLGLQLLAFAGCGPGAVVFSMLLMGVLTTRTHRWSAKRAIVTGGIAGIGVAFLNLPGYGAFFFLWDDNEPFLAIARVLLLFAVAGVTCGMWIGWQAWRGFRPNEGFLPRFTISTLLLIVLMWGTVLIAFQPDRRDMNAKAIAPVEAAE